MYHRSLRIVFAALTLSLGAVPTSGVAQDSSSSSGAVSSSSSAALSSAGGSILTAEGVLGDTDSKRRAPQLRVQPQVLEGRVRLLADAYIPHPDLQDHPIEFEFFINRKLFTTQIRSKSLPGAVGVDIGPDVAVPPFNYSVVAKVVHPNRTFTTVLEGAVVSATPDVSAEQFESCTITLTTVEGDEEEIELFVGNNVGVGQSTPTSAAFTFSAQKSDSTETASFEVTLTIEEGEAEGSVEVTRNGAAETYSVSGTAEVNASRPVDLSVSSDDEEVDITCS